MKIVFLNFWASKPGGAEFSLIDIIKEVSRNHQTVLITSESGFLTEKAIRFGCKSLIIKCGTDLSSFRRNHLFLHSISHFSTLVKFVRYCYTVKKAISSEIPDIIHANVPKSHIILQFLLSVGFKGKAIFHMREIYNHNSSVYLLYALLFRFHPASVIAISNAVLNSLPRSMKKNGTVIYNGVKIPEIISSKKHIHQNPQFLYLGRIVPWKGCELLIEAYALLVNKHPEKSGTLSIIGGTFYWNVSYRDILRDKILKLDLKNKISLLEHSNNTTILFEQHSVLCIPSYNEPFGRVAAEAMAFGLPVIGFNSGGLPEVVMHNETGLLGLQHDAESLYTLMEYFIIHPNEIERMGAKARERCIRLFDKNKRIPQIARAIIS